jgi:GTPase SAR1 family protein
MDKKIVLIGPYAAGKTSLRKFFFEQVSAEDVLKDPGMPTKAFRYHRYDYYYSRPFEKPGEIPERIPTSLSVVDTSGQEIEKWYILLKDKIFPRTDIVLFVFDVSEWDDEIKGEYIKDLISFVDDAREELAPGSMFHVIAHKFDKIGKDGSLKEEWARKVKSELERYLELKRGEVTRVEVIVTSLHEAFKSESFFALLRVLMEAFQPLQTS